MDFNLEHYKILGEKAGIKTGKLNKNFLFTLFCTDIFYYEKNIQINDIQVGFVDGKGDGGIDYITIHDDQLKIIQGKSSSNITYRNIIEYIDYIIDTINQIENLDNNRLNEKIIDRYLNTKALLDDDFNTEIVIFSAGKISAKIKYDLEKKLNEKKYQDYLFNIVDINDIELKKIEIETKNEFVKYGELLLSESGKYIKYEESYLANIKASSLKKLYLQSKASIFNYNLREYIGNKQVDSGIEKTIENEKENFWYFNNGITIVCSYCSPDGYALKLENFSIINGAQTTTIIGKSDIGPINDFDLVCKIVVNNNWNDKDDSSFINNISQASNSQKAIIPRDLKSNSREQRELQKLAAYNGKKSLGIEIKRGIKHPNYSAIDKEYKIKNDELGQLMLCCFFQRPGTARNGKRKIFDNSKLYKQIFLRSVDYDTLFDLVKLSNYYKEYKEKFVNRKKEPELLIIAQYAKFVTLATVFYLIKKQRNIINNYYDKALYEDNINGEIISNYKKDDLKELLFELFDVINEILSDIYEINHENAKTPSNFFKTDSNYHNIILKEFEKRINRTSYKDNIKKSMKIFS